MNKKRSHLLISVSILALLILIVSGCSKKPGNDLLNMKFTKVYVGGWMMETEDRQKPLSEADRLEITNIIQMSKWTYQKDLSVTTQKPIIVLYDALGAKVSISEYQGQALVYYVDASARNREFYFAPAEILPLIKAFNARIEPDLVIGDNEELPAELLNVWFTSAYVGPTQDATEDKWFELKQEDSLYIRAMLDMSRWSEAKDLSGYAFESYYMLKGDGGWTLSVGVLAEQALVSVINPQVGYARKVFYAPISVLGEIEEVLRRLSPVIEVEIVEFINANLSRAYIGDSWMEWDGKWFDLSEPQGSELRSLLRIEDWIVAHDLPARGLDVIYIVSSDDGISLSVCIWDEDRSLVGVSVVDNDIVRREFYYAPVTIILDGQNLLTQIRPASKYPQLSEELLNVTLIEVFTGVWSNDPDEFVEEWSAISAENAVALRDSLSFDSWVVAENLPPVGLNPQVLVRSADGIRIFGTIFDGKSLFGVTNEDGNSPAQYYFAPEWVVEFLVDLLESLGY
ncbi:MAG: hypothetical protein CVU85_00275 [Firmicutes bacterium HGW-Firmicutes-10]|jgi:hypothetical protein|nr:MAG: hypothetical protein CVU85_00275 [Firmicutes bacterium HGW-Firmicutes-10]